MANIVEYMRRTAPKTAREANLKSLRNTIRREAREYAQELIRVSETAKTAGFLDTATKAIDDFHFLCAWMAKFGVKDED
jgi:phage tail sheath gpL-like